MRKLTGKNIVCEQCSISIYIPGWRLNIARYCSKDCQYKSKERITRISKKQIGIPRPTIQEDKHYEWKGELVSYSGLHKCVNKHLGRPTTCEHCGQIDLIGRQIHWANKSQEYKRELSDWIRLCGKCHKKYDKKI